MSADEALQKIEKFKNSFKKNLEKNLSEFKKNITDIILNSFLLSLSQFINILSTNL